MLKKCKKAIYLLLLPKLALLVQVCFSSQLSFSAPAVIASYLTTFVILAFGASVDNYNKKHSITIEGSPHNPVYDCIAAYKAFKHFVRGGELVCQK